MIQVQDVAKFYGGKRALGPVSFQIEDGETVGFLGLNGAGKTTALRILACDLRPSAGSVLIGKTNALEDPHAVRRDVGFLPEYPPVYPDMTVRDFIRFAGRLRKMDAAAVEKRLPEVERTTQLEGVADELVRNLSHGFRQRVGVAQAIVHKPKLLILDEPTRGLDPVQVVEMRAMIRDLKQDHTILISSHILPEISETCDRLLILGEGKIVGQGTEQDLSKDLLGARRLAVTVKPGAGGGAAVTKAIEAVAGVTKAVAMAPSDDGAIEIEVDAEGDVRAPVAKAIVDGGHGLLRLDRSKRQLESIFLQLVQGKDKEKGAVGGRN